MNLPASTMMHPIVMPFRCAYLSARVKLATVLVVCFSICPMLLEAAGNTATNWLTREELLEKWEPVSMAEIKRLAEGGDASAQHYLGYCHVEGLRVPRNSSEGAAWYQRALENGYLPSANNLGVLYYLGLLETNDFTKAVEYTRFAADRGFAQSQMNMGVFYRDGSGVAADPREAVRWFRLAAAQGHAVAMVELGRACRFGYGVEQDLAEAVTWFERAANEKNNALARLNLGLLYEEEGNARQAVPFYEQAAEAGRTDAMVQLYFCFWNGRGVERDRDAAKGWLKKAADAENPHAECLMGIRCEDAEWVGEGPERHLTQPDLQGALRWYRRSAAQGWAGGQYHLGLMYLEGKTVALDEARGLELVRAAADQNLMAAVQELAVLYARGVGEPRYDSDRPVALLERAGAWEDLQIRYEHGLGTERNLPMAARCFCKWMLKGNSYYSQFGLSDLVEYKPATGDPMPRRLIDPADRHLTIHGPPHRDKVNASDDVLRVVSLYLKSARRDGEAAFGIGEYYEKGLDAPKSAASAWAWFNVAAQHGSAGASDMYRRLEKEMSAAEIKSAQECFSAIMADLNEVNAALR